MTLNSIIEGHGQAVREYSDLLNARCKSDTVLKSKLEEREREARTLAKIEPSQPFSHGHALLGELRRQEDWLALRDQAERLITSSDPALSSKAQHMLGLCLAQSGEKSDLEAAAVIFRAFTEGVAAVADDFAMLSTILGKMGSAEEAKDAVLAGLRQFPANRDGFVEIGLRLVEVTGDRLFRDQLTGLRPGK